MGITNGLSTIAGIAGPYVLAEFIDKNVSECCCVLFVVHCIII